MCFMCVIMYYKCVGGGKGGGGSVYQKLTGGCTVSVFCVCDICDYVL